MPDDTLRERVFGRLTVRRSRRLRADEVRVWCRCCCGAEVERLLSRLEAELARGQSPACPDCRGEGCKSKPRTHFGDTRQGLPNRAIYQRWRYAKRRGSLPDDLEDYAAFRAHALSRAADAL